MRTAIIGAGISGISAGRMLADRGGEPVIYEKNNAAGGLIRCEWIDGNLFHQVGGHVFNSRNKEVLDWFWSFFNPERDFIQAKRNAKILLNGKYIGYPIENYLYQLDKKIIGDVIKDILELNRKDYIDPLSYPDFESFLKSNFGETLYHLYFGPYNQKIWKMDLKDIPLAWLEGKLPMPDYREILKSNILQEEEAEMVHSTFYYPKKGGSQFIIDRLSEGLSIKCGFEVDRIEKRSQRWFINEEGPFDQVLYTADIRNLHAMLKPDIIQSAHLKCLADLKSNGTSNMLCYTDDTDISWLYLPDKNTLAHRIIYTGNFSSENNNKKGRKTCVVEFSGQIEKGIMENEVKKLPGNLEPIASNYEANSYVIQEPDTRPLIRELKQRLRNFNFYLSGRFAEWEYYNMDMVIKANLDIIKDQTVGTDN